jgi:transposase
MNVRYRVELSQAERSELTAMLSKGKRAARKLKRAQILLAADAGCSDEEIARTVAVGGSTVCRTKRRFVEGNLERALSEDPRPGAERKLTGKEEALLVATACANPPEGRARWTLELLADAMVMLTGHQSLSGETVRRRLAENDLKPWRKDMWCIRSQAAGGLLRREPGPAHRRGASADSRRAGSARTLRLRVPPQRHRQSLRLRRRASALAQGQGHRAAGGRRLRPMHA